MYRRGGGGGEPLIQPCAYECFHGIVATAVYFPPPPDEGGGATTVRLTTQHMWKILVCLLCTVRHIVVSLTENRIELTCASLDRVVTGTR